MPPKLSGSKDSTATIGKTVDEHLKGIYAEGELAAGTTIRKFRIVRTEGKREVAREIEHYNLDAILTVGFRVRSHRGTQIPVCLWFSGKNEPAGKCRAVSDLELALAA